MGSAACIAAGALHFALGPHFVSTEFLSDLIELPAVVLKAVEEFLLAPFLLHTYGLGDRRCNEERRVVRALRSISDREAITMHSERRRFCVYNKTRECFLSLGVTAANTTFSRLRGLIGRFHLRSDEGIWVVPSSGVHTLGVLVPLDLIYLDASHRVIHQVEHFPTFRIAPIRTDSDSVLELPTHTIYSSQTQVGDNLLICPAEEMEKHFSFTSRFDEDRVMATEA